MSTVVVIIDATKYAILHVCNRNGSIGGLLSLADYSRKLKPLLSAGMIV